ncbi:hypothetical protein HYX16_04900 [Candidatus Woesearchaeota archaeon]|nr:hypothetical protein [Candidatus Woesearchaeota archaeon]
MAVDTIVSDPGKIKNINELDNYLSKILLFEKTTKQNCGVILIQRRQFGGLYEIVSEEEAKKKLQKLVTSTTPEFGIRFYPRSYFEGLREKLLQEQTDSVKY